MRHALWVLILSLLVLNAGTADAAWLRPLQGSGNFFSIVDVTNHWTEEGQLEVILMVAIPNRELTFEKQGARLIGELNVTVEIAGWDGTVVQGEKTVRTRARDELEAGSGTLYQVFPIVVPNVTVRSGRLYCRITDENRNRIGLYNIIRKKKARSEVTTDWSVDQSPRVDQGLSVGDPVFMAGAPIGFWIQQGRRDQDFFQEDFVDFLHPSRRYGLEQEKLQIYFEVQPPLEANSAAEASSGLLVTVQAKDLQFAMRDTVVFNETALSALGGGRCAGIYYELDVNNLPPGSFQLSIAPASGQGRGWVAEFDVAWRIGTVARHVDELLGEGRTVLFGPRLKKFLASTPPEQEIILEKFWHEMDPDPETSVNEVYQEFRRRVAYVRRHFNGFTKVGAADPRGEVYILLGPPDEVEINNMPLNASDQEDATIKVFSPFAPDRAGTAAKGSDDPSGGGGITPYSRSGGVPMPYSPQAESEITQRRNSSSRERAYERWEYNHSGNQLFVNKYTGRNMGLGFLFVDRTGSGDYKLESTNAWTGND